LKELCVSKCFQSPYLEGSSKNCYVSHRALRKEKRTPVQVNIPNPRPYSYSEVFPKSGSRTSHPEFFQKTCVWVYEFKRTDPYQPGKLFSLPTAKLKPLCIIQKDPRIITATVFYRSANISVWPTPPWGVMIYIVNLNIIPTTYMMWVLGLDLFHSQFWWTNKWNIDKQ
jgi:hypothetical protein